MALLKIYIELIYDINIGFYPYTIIYITTHGDISMYFVFLLFLSVFVSLSVSFFW